MQQSKEEDKTIDRPPSIKEWVAYLSRGIHEDVLKRDQYQIFLDNLSCSILYLEHLDHQIAEASLDEVIRILHIKTFVITAMSVAESILFYILCSHSALAMREWEDVFRELMPAPLPNNDQEFHALFVLREKLSEPRLSSVRLNQMLKKVKKEKFLGADSAIYESLDHLRMQRNRVHIHDVDAQQHADWQAFRNDDLSNAKDVLHLMLSSIQPDQSDADILDFLKQGDATSKE